MLVFYVFVAVQGAMQKNPYLIKYTKICPFGLVFQYMFLMICIHKFKFSLDFHTVKKDIYKENKKQ